MRLLVMICACSLLAGLARAGPTQPAPALLDVLPSPDPVAGLAAPATYDGLLGDWDVVVTDYDTDGTSHRGTGEWHFGRVLEGRAIQDVWISPRRGERPPSSHTPGPRNRYGSTIRFFDPTIDAWRVTWVNPAQNYVATLVGRSSGSEIVQEGEGDSGERLRWVFSEITPAGFQWRGDVSADGGRTWRRAQEMTALRATVRVTGSTDATDRMMGALVAPVSVHGPGRSETHGAAAPDPRRDMVAELAAPGPHPSLGADARDFDRLVGTWDCDYSFLAEDGSVRHSKGELRFGWIIDGRALQDIWIGYPTRPNDERRIGTSVRFFDTKARIWRVVFVAPAFGIITIMEGGAEEDHIVLRGKDPDGSSLRWSFNDIRAGSFTWRGEVSRDGGKTWRIEEEHHMRRRTGA